MQQAITLCVACICSAMTFISSAFLKKNCKRTPSEIKWPNTVAFFLVSHPAVHRLKFVLFCFVTKLRKPLGYEWASFENMIFLNEIQRTNDFLNGCLAWVLAPNDLYKAANWNLFSKFSHHLPLLIALFLFYCQRFKYTVRLVGWPNLLGKFNGKNPKI